MAKVVTAKIEASAVPISVPNASGPLSTDKGKVSSVTAGSTVTLTGAGYLPNSTVTLVMYSTPTVLGTTVADANGNISATVTIPAGLAAGSHTLVATGVDSTGAAHNLTMAVTLASTGDKLASTGADIKLPILGGLVALSIGGGLIVASRRRTVA